MKRKLIQQMRNEWRSNLWMTVELVIVGVVIWGVFTVFASIAHLHQPPVGVDFNDIYFGNVGVVSKNASTYKEYPDSVHSIYTDLETLIANLRTNPYVENVGTGNNAIPYNFNYNGMSLNTYVADTVQAYIGNQRMMDADMVRTLRLTGFNGETSEQLAEMVSEGKWLISTYDRSYYVNDPAKWVGKEAWIGRDTTDVVQIGVLINGIRRADYEPVFNGTLVMSYPWRVWFPNELAVRVKPGKGREFLASVQADDLEFGNVYVSNLQSIENRKTIAHRDVITLVRNLSACAAFVLIAVFLGFLGSFWYRTQQRIPELALRKVNGATDTDLFRRSISEGLILLCVATPFIVGIAALLSDLPDDLGLTLPAWLMWSMIPVTLVLLALMICGGIWLPARKAMKINPAAALKDQ